MFDGFVYYRLFIIEKLNKFNKINVTLRVFDIDHMDHPLSGAVGYCIIYLETILHHFIGGFGVKLKKIKLHLSI